MVTVEDVSVGVMRSGVGCAVVVVTVAVALCGGNEECCGWW